MAIQTIKATIQMRHGNEPKFDPDKMTAGEWAVSTDTKKVWMCFQPGFVLRMATYEAFEADMKEIQLILAACQDIQSAVERFKQLALEHKNKAEEWSVVSKSWAVGGTGTRKGENTDNSKYYSEQSKAEANRAKNEADRAAAIAGINVDSELSETSANPVQNKVITKALNEIDVDISNKSVEFEEAENRENIESGEKIPVLFSKIKKFIADLKTVAFTGKYTDLTDLPEIPVGTNNLLATEPGTWLDAMQGKALADMLDEINSNLQKYDAYYNYLAIPESGMDDLKIPGNYTVYVTSATTDKFKTGILLLLEIRRVYFPPNKALGYIQRATGVYGMSGSITRHWYSATKWSSWV